MINTAAPKSPAPGPFKNEHLGSKSAQSLPAWAVLLDVVRNLEIQFQKRGLLGPAGAFTHTPIWFLAETERNVFLWRNGLSLTEEASFEFWVDLRALVEKRLLHLNSRDQPDNPFLNPLWGISAAPTQGDLAANEEQYLAAFSELARKIEEHIHALSHFGSVLQQKLNHGDNERHIILLPWRSGKNETPTANPAKDDIS